MTNHRRKSSFANYRGQHGAEYHKAKHRGGPFVDEIIARLRIQKFQPYVKETDTVLEYGVGTGYNLMKLRCREKVGYDVADYCRAKVESSGIYFTSDMQEVLKWQRRFDVVICHHVLEHVPNPAMELSRIRQLLKPAGRLLLYVPFERERRFQRFNPCDLDMHLFSWSPQSICNLLLTASYEIDDTKICSGGYDRFLAPLAKVGFWIYKAGMWLALLVRPSYEICVVARPGPRQKESD